MWYDVQHHVATGGKAWDTVKPLGRWFKDLSRVILVDDDAFKVRRFPLPIPVLASFWTLLDLSLPACTCRLCAISVH